MRANMSDLFDFELPPDPREEKKPRGNNGEGKQTPEQQGSNIPVNFRPTMAKPLPAVRCTGTIRQGDRAGERCNAWSLAGATVCLKHGGHLPNVKQAAEDRKQAARLKIVDIAEDAADIIEHLMHYATQENIRLAAAKDVLDRAGVKGGVDINVNVEHTLNPVDIINQRLNDIAERVTPENTGENTNIPFTLLPELDIIKSEVVDEDENTEDSLTNE